MQSTYRSSNYVSTGGKNLSRERERLESEVPEGMILDLNITYLTHDDILNTKNSSMPNFFRVVVERKEYNNLTRETIVGSLYDPALGVPPMIGGGLLVDKCSTCEAMNADGDDCGLTTVNCGRKLCKGGHFGVILFTKQKERKESGPGERQKPAKNYNKIFNPKDAPFNEAVRIASCVCHVCNKLILPKSYLEKKNVLLTPEANRLFLVEELTKRTGKAERECKCKTRNYVKTASRADGSILYSEGASKTASKSLGAEEWYNTMAALAKDDSLKYLGYNKLSNLDKCTLVGVVVPGIEMRPPKIINGNQSPHEYTLALSAIVDHSNRWKQAIRRSKIDLKLKLLGLEFIGNPKLRETQAKVADLTATKAAILNRKTVDEKKLSKIDIELGREEERKDFLQKLAIELRDEWPGEATAKFQAQNNVHEAAKNTYKAVKEYADLIGSKFLTKEGIMRSGVNTRRSDFSGRAVITPSSYRLDVVEVPEAMAYKCGIQDDVTEANIAQYRVMLTQGKINHIFSYRRGNFYPVYVTQQAIAAGRCRIQVGDKITRWLMDGDVALVNRQPSLHPGNMYTFYSKIVPRMTIGLPFPVTVPFAGDFDGDTVAISFPQSPEARAEAIRLAHSKKNIIGVRTGAPIMGIIYNALKSLYVMTSMEKLLPKYIFYDALTLIEMNTGRSTYEALTSPLTTVGGSIDVESFRARCIAHGVHPLSGKALFSYLLPDNFKYPPDGRPNSRGVLIVNGILVKGIIKKEEVAANIQGTIVHYLQVHYGWERAAQFIESGSLLGEYFSQHFPSAMPATDCLGLICSTNNDFISSELEQITTKIRELGPEPSDPYELERYNARLASIHQRTGVANQKLYNKFAKESAKEEWKNYYAEIRAAYEKLSLAIRDGDYRVVRQDEQTRDAALRLVEKMRVRRLDFEQIAADLFRGVPLSEADTKLLLRNVNDARVLTEEERDDLRSTLQGERDVDSQILELVDRVNTATPNYVAIANALYEGEDVAVETAKSLQFFIAQEYERLTNMDELTYNQFYLGIQSGTKGSAQEFGEMTGIIGQLSTSETLFVKDMSGGTRCASVFRVDDPDPASRGFIASNYVRGLTGDQKFDMHKPQREAAAYGVSATPDAGVIEKELANSIGKYRTELNALTSETDHLLQLLVGDDGLGVYKSIEINGIQLPFDPRTLVDFVNTQLGWVKLPDDNWYHKHTVNGKIYYVKL